MADRWSNPSGGTGDNRFRVWPAGSDSYDHIELTANWDANDGILGGPPSGVWPPTRGTNGGIYALIKDLQDRIDDLEDHTHDDEDDPVLVIDDKYIIGYGTAFPASPPDGKHFVLVNSTSNPTWAFQARWVAAASAWIVNGGGGPLSATNGAQVDIDTFSLSLSLPRPGTYKVQVGGTVSWFPELNQGGHLYVNGPGGAQAFLDAGLGNISGNRVAHAASIVSQVVVTTGGGSFGASGAATGAFGAGSYKRIQNGWITAWPLKFT